jgi:hypothetical protein
MITVLLNGRFSSFYGSTVRFVLLYSTSLIHHVPARPALLGIMIVLCVELDKWSRVDSRGCMGHLSQALVKILTRP